MKFKRNQARQKEKQIGVSDKVYKRITTKDIVPKAGPTRSPNQKIKLQDTHFKNVSE